MSKSGTIKLIDSSGEVVVQRVYDGPCERKRLMADWQMIYGRKAMKECTVQYAPDVNINKINPDGTNSKDEVILTTRNGRYVNAQKQLHVKNRISKRGFVNDKYERD